MKNINRIFNIPKQPSMQSIFTIVCAGLLTTLILPATPAQADDQYRMEITNSWSHLKADVIDASQNTYQGVFLWPDNASASQEFDLLDSGNGYFRIRARHSGQCLMLDWRYGNYTNGTRIIQYPFCGTGYAQAEWRQEWVHNPVNCSAEGIERVCTTTNQTRPVLVNRFTGKCLDVSNPSSNPPLQQSMLQQWECVRTTEDWNIGNQVWSISAPGTREAYL